MTTKDSNNQDDGYPPGYLAEDGFPHDFDHEDYRRWCERTEKQYEQEFGEPKPDESDGEKP